MIDHATITLRAGNGGRGVTSFRREKFIPKGGPDGGDGGRGGDIIIRATNQLSTLLDFQYKKVFEAPHGEAGSSRNRHGRDGSNIVIEVPIGTTITVSRIEKEKIISMQRKGDHENKVEYKQIVLNYKKMERQQRFANYEKSRLLRKEQEALRELIVENIEPNEDTLDISNVESLPTHTYPPTQESPINLAIEQLNNSNEETPISEPNPTGNSINSQETDNSPLPQVNAPVYDLVTNGQTLIIARGGRGGRGNDHFKSPSHQTPLESERGQKGEVVEIDVQLKLIANVGIIGFPNAGKSTLLTALTAATPKIGNYPFTTLDPNLGVMKSDQDTIVLADLPGLIEGAHTGKGLGIRFLKHVERTSILLHLIAIPDEVLQFTPEEISQELLKLHQTIRSELILYKKDLENKEELLVINKIDLLSENSKSGYISAIESAFALQNLHPIFISAQSHQGTQGLQKILFDKLNVPIV